MENLASLGFNTDADAISGQSLREDLKRRIARRKSVVAWRGRRGADGGVETGFGKSRGIVSRQPHAEQSGRNRRRNQKTISLRESFNRLSKGKSGFGFERDFAWLKTGRPFAAGRKTIFVEATRAVYDMIYRPAETTLLAAAKRCRLQNRERPRNVAASGREGV